MHVILDTVFIDRHELEFLLSVLKGENHEAATSRLIRSDMIRSIQNVLARLDRVEVSRGKISATTV